MALKRWQFLYRLALGSAVSLASVPALWAEEATPPEPATIASHSASKAVASDEEGESADDRQTEIIVERYADRAVKVERHVAQDTEGNYFNHGLWTQWDRQGALMGAGEYKNGKREGKWIRWFEGNESAFFADPSIKQFQAPFVAEATFVEGRLHGSWTILDSKSRKVSEWPFHEGELHGDCVWHFASLQKRKIATYNHGQLDGVYQEWTLDARGNHVPVVNARYENGRRHAQKVEWHAAGKKQGHKKVEGWYLHAREIVAVNADFWNGIFEIKITGKDGIDQKQGKWTWWYKDGGKQLEGEYDANEQIGLHTWWHSNGQKHIEGAFEAGKEVGRWVWWYPNGQKQLEGQYAAGEQTGNWMKWNEQGKVLEVQEVAIASHPAAEDEGVEQAVVEEPKQEVRKPPLRLDMTQRARGRALLKR